MKLDRRTHGKLIPGLVLLLAAVAGVQAQQTPAPGATTAAAGPETKISLDLRDVPFRTAIDALFGPTGLQFAIEPTMPNIPVTVSLRDVDYSVALRTILRLAQATYRKDTNIYVIGPRVPESQQPQTTEVVRHRTGRVGVQVTSEQRRDEWSKIPMLEAVRHVREVAERLEQRVHAHVAEVQG